MQFRNHLISMLLVMLCWSPQVWSQGQVKSLSYEEALQLMQENNPALKQAKEQIIQKEFEQKARKGMFLPQVSVNAKAVAMSEELHLDLTPVSEAIVPLYETLGTYGTFTGVPNPDPATNGVMPILPDDLSTQAVRGQLLAAGEEIANTDWNVIIQEKNFASVTADIVWPILAGGRIRGAYNAAGVNVEMSKEDLRKTEAELMTELATRYYGLVLANQVADVRLKSYEFMKQHYENSQTLFENGMIPKLELLHASVSMAEAEREYSKAKRDVTIINAGLMATLNLDSSQMIVPTSDLFMKSNGNTTSHWVRSAIAHNPQLKQIDKKRSLVEIKSKVNRQQYLPSVALMGSYNIAEADLSPYAPHWMFGLGMKWTVFSGFARSNSIKESKCMMDQIDHAEEKAHADIEAYLINLYQKLEMYREQKAQLELTLEMSKEYLASSEEAFNQGMANSLSVVDAQLKISQVEALILKSMYEYDVTMALIYQTAGVPEEFKSITVNSNN